MREPFYVRITNFHAFAGICYGFEVLRICESPNIPFTILFQRFQKGIAIDV